uniref:ERM_C domain-containing protein n=1 Tax=Ascaris lumbricoides TaxID=6252 RepID=A0A0M3IIX7_ASCLU
MSEFRAEIESLKVEDRQTEHDRIHAANVQKGIDKYSTLRKSSGELSALRGVKSSGELSALRGVKSGAGSTKSRVQVFEGL